MQNIYTRQEALETIVDYHVELFNQAEISLDDIFTHGWKGFDTYESKELAQLLTEYFDDGEERTVLEKDQTFYYLCINDETELEQAGDGYSCPKCGCHTIAPEEDGMSRYIK